MKITLRTLLLWRDGVLAPAEQEAFGARVAQHRNASGLELRIHAALLHPPAHDDGSIGAFVELNRVAEYIDNALPPEDLAVFERQCIESVSQLSEVAACHGMLSDLYLRRVKLPAPEPGLRQEIQQAVRSVVGHASEAGGGRVTGPSVAEARAAQPLLPVSSRQAALAVLEEFDIARSLPPQPHDQPHQPSPWQRLSLDGTLHWFGQQQPAGAVEEAVVAEAATPRLAADRVGWRTILAAGFALAAILSLGGAVAMTLQGPQAYRPGPGCFHCTEP